METIWTLAAPAWQWVVGVVVFLWLWETWLEKVFYWAKHWVLQKPHNKTTKRDM